MDLSQRFLSAGLCSLWLAACGARVSVIAGGSAGAQATVGGSTGTEELSGGAGSVSVSGGTAVGGTTSVSTAGATSGGIAGAESSEGGASGSAGASNAGDAPPPCPCTSDLVCLDGVCRARPILLTQIKSCATVSMALYGDVLYFTDSAAGLVESISTSGGKPITLASAQAAPYAIAADASGVYWSNTSTTPASAADNALMMKTPTGAPLKITDVDQSSAPAQATNIVRSLTLDGNGSLYYGSRSDLMKVKASPASTPTKVGQLEGFPTAIVLVPAQPPRPARVFTTLMLDNAIQWRSPEPGPSGCVDPISRPGPLSGETAAQAAQRINRGACAFAESIGGLLFDTLKLIGNDLLFSNDSYMEFVDPTISANMESQTQTLAGTQSFDAISGFVNNEKALYFGEQDTGIIETVSLPPVATSTGAVPTILVQDPVTEPAPGAFLIDAHNVYWRTQGASCSIMKLAL